MPRLLWLFAAVNLVIGTSAFMLPGILAPLAQGLNVSIPAAGQGMSTYALGIALVGPPLLLLTGRWSRRSTLLACMALFTLGCILSAAAQELWQLLAGRFLMGVGALFTPIATGIAVALAPPGQQGRAMSRVFLGMSLSYVIGVPLGTWLAAHHGWHLPLWLAAAASALATLGLAVAVPRQVAAPGASFIGAPALLARGDVLSVLGLTVLYFTAIFSIMSYSAPVFVSLVPMDADALSATMVVFGLAGVAGTFLGGWAVDRFGPARSLRVQLTVLLLAMAALPLTRGHHGMLLLVMVTWGMAGFSMMAPQLSRLAALAPRQAPLLLSLNTSMLYIGTALGAALGGAAAAAWGLHRLGWVGAVVAAAGLVLLLATARRTAAGAASPPAS
ncbi:MAG: MFS transporter [Aquabacterium sp.]